jgi:hypothetical protein
MITRVLLRGLIFFGVFFFNLRCYCLYIYTLFCMVLCGFTAATIRRIVEERREIKGVVCEVTVFSNITLPHFWWDNVRGGNIYLTIYVLKPSDRNGSTQSQRTNKNLGAFRRGKCGPACASIIVDITCVFHRKLNKNDCKWFPSCMFFLSPTDAFTNVHQFLSSFPLCGKRSKILKIIMAVISCMPPHAEYGTFWGSKGTPFLSDWHDDSSHVSKRKD